MPTGTRARITHYQRKLRSTDIHCKGKNCYIVVRGRNIKLPGNTLLDGIHGRSNMIRHVGLRNKSRIHTFIGDRIVYLE